MIVYADVMFLLNLVMDFIVLFVTGKLMKKRCVINRIIAAAFELSIVYCLILFTELYFIMNLFTGLVLIMSGVWIAFRPKTLADLVKTTAICYTASFIIGGMATALISSGQVVEMIRFGIKNISLWVLIISSAAAYFAVKLIGKAAKKAQNSQKFYDIKISCAGRQTMIHSLVDTGNSLIEPVSGVPVIIVEFSAVKALLPEKIRMMFHEKNEDDLNQLLQSVYEEDFSLRLRVIPFKSIGEKNGMMIGFRPDKTEIMSELNRSFDIKAIIGISNTAFASDREYQGLINPDLINS